MRTGDLAVVLETIGLIHPDLRPGFRKSSVIGIAPMAFFGSTLRSLSAPEAQEATCKLLAAGRSDSVLRAAVRAIVGLVAARQQAAEDVRLTHGDIVSNLHDLARSLENKLLPPEEVAQRVAEAVATLVGAGLLVECEAQAGASTAAHAEVQFMWAGPSPIGTQQLDRPVRAAAVSSRQGLQALIAARKRKPRASKLNFDATADSSAPADEPGTSLPEKQPVAAPPAAAESAPIAALQPPLAPHTVASMGDADAAPSPSQERSSVAAAVLTSQPGAALPPAEKPGVRTPSALGNAPPTEPPPLRRPLNAPDALPQPGEPADAEATGNPAEEMPASASGSAGSTRRALGSAFDVESNAPGDAMDQPLVSPTAATGGDLPTPDEDDAEPTLEPSPPRAHALAPSPPSAVEEPSTSAQPGDTARTASFPTTAEAAAPTPPEVPVTIAARVIDDDTDGVRLEPDDTQAASVDGKTLAADTTADDEAELLSWGVEFMDSLLRGTSSRHHPIADEFDDYDFLATALAEAATDACEQLSHDDELLVPINLFDDVFTDSQADYSHQPAADAGGVARHAGAEVLQAAGELRPPDASVTKAPCALRALNNNLGERFAPVAERKIAGSLQLDFKTRSQGRTLLTLLHDGPCTTAYAHSSASGALATSEGSTSRVHRAHEGSDKGAALRPKRLVRGIAQCSSAPFGMPGHARASKKARCDESPLPEWAVTCQPSSVTMAEALARDGHMAELYSLEPDPAAFDWGTASAVDTRGECDIAATSAAHDRESLQLQPPAAVDAIACGTTAPHTTPCEHGGHKLGGKRAKPPAIVGGRRRRARGVSRSAPYLHPHGVASAPSSSLQFAPP